MYLRWPTFESRDREESQHRFGNIIEVKTILLPRSVLHGRFIDITVVELQISTSGKESGSCITSAKYASSPIARESVLLSLLRLIHL